MRKNLLWAAIFFAALAFTPSCEKDNDAPKQPVITVDSVCLIVNQGNFSESNGSFSLYSTTTNSVTNGFKSFAAILVDVAITDTLGMASCNNSDKVEFFDPRTFATLSVPITDVNTPRFIAIRGDKAYVSCWGTYNSSTWAYESPVIAEIDMANKTKLREVPCSNEPEGMYVVDNALYVAVADGVEVYTLPGLTFSQKISTNFSATARQINKDKNNKLWVSFNGYVMGTTGFAVIDTQTKNVVKEITVDKLDADGRFALNKDKSQVLFAAPTSENWTVVSSDIFAINVATYTISSTPLISGTSLSTIGVNPWNGDIYTANTDYSSNNELLIYDQNGTQKNTAMVGIAPQKFIFY